MDGEAWLSDDPCKVEISVEISLEEHEEDVMLRVYENEVQRMLGAGKRK
jgi:hypothetical protein